MHGGGNAASRRTCPAHRRDLDVDKAADDLFRRYAVAFDDATLVLVDV